MKEVTGASATTLQGGECLTCHDAHASNFGDDRGEAGQGLLRVSFRSEGSTEGRQEQAFSRYGGRVHEVSQPPQGEIEQTPAGAGADLCLNCHKDLKEKMQKEKTHSPSVAIVSDATAPISRGRGTCLPNPCRSFAPNAQREGGSFGRRTSTSTRWR